MKMVVKMEVAWRAGSRVAVSGGTVVEFAQVVRMAVKMEVAWRAGSRIAVNEGKVVEFARVAV